MVTQTYPSMAAALGIPYCHGIGPTGHYCHLLHKSYGSVWGGTIHFSDRPVTKVETQWFLKLAAQAVEPDLYDDVPWRRVYRMDRIARELGLRLGIQLPARLWSHDKAFVLAGVAALGNDVPLRKQAYDWARR